MKKLITLLMLLTTVVFLINCTKISNPLEPTSDVEEEQEIVPTNTPPASTDIEIEGIWTRYTEVMNGPNLENQYVTNVVDNANHNALDLHYQYTTNVHYEETAHDIVSYDNTDNTYITEFTLLLSWNTGDPSTNDFTSFVSSTPYMKRMWIITDVTNLMIINTDLHSNSTDAQNDDVYTETNTFTKLN